MLLMAAITGEVSYMPAKAVVSPQLPSRQGKKPAAVTSSMSTDVNTGRAFCVLLGMNRS